MGRSCAVALSIAGVASWMALGGAGDARAALAATRSYPPAAGIGAGADPRSRAILSYECHTETSHRELTLFANGTLRLRDGVGATREMRLAELAREQLDAYVRRLDGVGFDDLAPQSPGPEGDWVERCRLELALPKRESRSLDYGRYDSIPLGWKHVLLVVDDLLQEFESRSEASGRVRDYDPEPGDILVRRRDGARYEVLGKTLEGTGVELQGLDEPMTIFILLDHLLDEFDPPEDGGG